MSKVITQKTVDEKKLNETIKGLVEHLKENPGDAKASFEAKSTLSQGFQTKVHVRDFEFDSDEPEQLGGTNIGPNPVEYVLGALAACQEIVVKTHAALLGINIDSVKVDVTGDVDLLGFLNVSEERAGFSNVKFNTVIETDEKNPEKLEKLKEVTIDRCPVLDIIQNPVPVEGSVRFAE